MLTNCDLRPSTATDPRLSEIIDHLPGVLYRAIIHTGQQVSFTYISQGMRDLTGMLPDEAITRLAGMSSLVHPQDKPQFETTFRLAAATLQPFYHEYRLITANGIVKWVRDSAHFSYTDQGDVMMDGYCLDISHAIQLQQQSSYSVPGASIAEASISRAMEEQQNPVRDRLLMPASKVSPEGPDQAQQLYWAGQLMALVSDIHACLVPGDILHIAASYIRELLELDRVTASQFGSDGHGLCLVDETAPDWPDMLCQVSYDAGLELEMDILSRGDVYAVEDIHCLPPSLQTLWGWQQQQVRAMLVLPILVHGNLWGTFILYQHHRPRSWGIHEVNFLKQMAHQVGIALWQTEKYQQLQRHNSDLERKYRAHSAQLQLAFEFEETLKRITDKVRDSLDEDQILQTAVQELTLAIGISGCNAALYDLERRTSTIRYEYTTSVSPSQGRVCQMDAFPELYDQLLAGQSFQFCSLMPHPLRGRVAMLACPIQDDQGVLGDLWLINHKFYAFSQQDIRLVQQVANQCAIALRQARLYEAAQAQVAELERLNQLKDDFLSTVSHELRTPIASIKMASQMLELTLNRAGLMDTEHSPIARYLQILQRECNREINLVNDLLDLSQLETAREQTNVSRIPLQNWLAELVEPFVKQTETQQQYLAIQLPSENVYLDTDVPKLERILVELLQNACKYTPAREHIWLSIQINSKGTEICVRNSGVEIPVEERSRIFEKFYRIPNTEDPWKYGGTGLGLALVKKLVEQLRGQIDVNSADRITSFTVQIPR
jgi:PAS domain S-box-containing protein